MLVRRASPKTWILSRYAKTILCVWGLGCAEHLWGQGRTPVSRPVPVSSTVMAKQLLTKVDPEFPSKAAEQGISGDVVIDAEVGADGYIEHVGVVSGPPVLQAAALFAVRQWTYKPYSLDGKPVAVETTVTLRFGSGHGPAISEAGPTTSTSVVSSPSADDAGTRRAVVTRMGQGTARSMPVDWLAGRRVPVPSKQSDGVKAGMGGANGLRLEAGGGGSGASAFIDTRETLAENHAPRFARPSAVLSDAAGAPSVDRATALRKQAPVDMTPTLNLDRLRDLNSPQRLPGRWRLVKQAVPVYPEAAEAKGIEGVVVVQGVIKKDGTLHELHAVSGPIELHQAAIDAAAQYEYAADDGGRGNVPTTLSVEFLLTGPAKLPASWMAGQIEHSVTPDYPVSAEAAGVTGSVALHVLVGREGEVKKAEVVSGPAMLRETAMESVKQWRYKPQMRNGAHVEVDTTVMVAFTMAGSGVQ